MLNGGLDQFLQAVRPFLYENDVAECKNLGNGEAVVIVSNPSATPGEAASDPAVEQFQTDVGLLGQQ